MARWGRRGLACTDRQGRLLFLRIRRLCRLGPVRSTPKQEQRGRWDGEPQKLEEIWTDGRQGGTDAAAKLRLHSCQKALQCVG
jgi:hypothetical protein